MITVVITFFINRYKGPKDIYIERVLVTSNAEEVRCPFLNLFECAIENGLSKTNIHTLTGKLMLLPWLSRGLVNHSAFGFRKFLLIFL